MASVIRMSREHFEQGFDGPPTPDEVSVTVDGRRLDTKDAVLAWWADVSPEIEAEHSANYVLSTSGPLDAMGRATTRPIPRPTYCPGYPPARFARATQAQSVEFRVRDGGAPRHKGTSEGLQESQ